jgi:hypothetical protein
MKHGRVFSLSIRAKEDRRAEDTMERSHEPAVLRTALLHPERIQHLRRAAESDPRTLLPDRERREKDWDQPVLPPWQSEARLSCDLQDKLPVTALMQQASWSGPLHRQTAKNEWPRREPEVLRFGLPLRSNGTNPVRLTNFPLRNDEFGMQQSENVTGFSQTGGARRNRGRFQWTDVQGLNPRRNARVTNLCQLRAATRSDGIAIGL